VLLVLALFLRLRGLRGRGGLEMRRFLRLAIFCILHGLISVGLLVFSGILVVLIGVRIGHRLVLGGMGRFLLCVFGIRLCGSGLELLFVRKAACRLLRSFLLLLGL